ncbi:MAG TPA: hypothetical protein VKT82_01185 [Ktedonobacterales bacterium]|nr:hypothetical protein [Ktedonobacterales bacterium]
MSLEQPTEPLDKLPEDKGKSKLPYIITLIAILVPAGAGIIVAWTPYIAPLIFHPAPTPTVAMSTDTLTPGPSSPLLVQSNFGTSTDSTNAVQFGQPVRKGDLILVAITQFERQVTNLKDNQGDGYQKIGGTFANPDEGQDYVELYYFQNVAGGSATTVTVTFSGFKDPDGGGTNVGIYEYAGLSATSPRDDADTNTSNDQATKTLKAGKQLTASEGNEICFAVGVDSGPQDNNPYSDSISAGQDYTLLYPATSDQQQGDDAKSAERFYTEAALVQQGGCIPNFSIAYPSTWAIVSVALKP